MRQAIWPMLGTCRLALLGVLGVLAVPSESGSLRVLRVSAVNVFLKAYAAIDDHGLTGHEHRVVGCEVYAHVADLLGVAEPPHRLPRDEVLARLHRIRERVDAV